MAYKTVPMTREGRERFAGELEHLRSVRRSEVAERIHQARDETRPQNSAEYEDARHEQTLVERRILELEQLLACAVLIDESACDGAEVRVGSTVKVEQHSGESEFTIVGSAEASPLKGRISNESPVGRALLGKRIGDTVQVAAPAGAITMVVKAIR